MRGGKRPLGPFPEEEAGELSRTRKKEHGERKKGSLRPNHKRSRGSNLKCRREKEITAGRK